MNSLENATNEFIAQIKNTEEYKQYVIHKDKIERFGELKARINQYRKDNFVLQTTIEDDNMFEKLEEFEQKYADINDNPLVNDFLSAEVAFCQMVRNAYLSITEALKIQ